MKHVSLVHTSLVLLDVLNSHFDQILPNVKRTHIVEHSILQDVLDADKVTPDVLRRMLGYFVQAEATGADVIFNVCSSVGETVDIARQFINIPIIKIDDAMAEEAIEIGQRIGVLATLNTTLAPTCRLVDWHADQRGIQIEVTEGLCEGAFEALTSGDTDGHDKMVGDKIIEISRHTDVIVLAQASMARVLNALPEGEVTVPILTSPERGVRYLKNILDQT